MSAVSRSGDWAFAAGFLGRIGARTKGALELSVRREALLAEREMKKGIAEQAPGGKTFKALSEWTLIKRKAQGFRGSKALIRRGDLRRSIKTVGPVGGAFFTGVLRTARGRAGQPLVNVARVHEFGATIVLNVDKRGRKGGTVRQYFWALVKKGLLQKPLKESTKFLVVTVPPRPFIRPVFEKLTPGREARMTQTIAGALGLPA